MSLYYCCCENKNYKGKQPRIILQVSNHFLSFLNKISNAIKFQTEENGVKTYQPSEPSKLQNIIITILEYDILLNLLVLVLS